MSNRRVIAIDVETRKFRPGYMAPHVVCLSEKEEGHESKLWAGNDVEERLSDLMREVIRTDSLIVGHNIAYDFACILASYPSLWDYVWIAYSAGLISCTGIRERLLNIASGNFGDQSGYSLAALSKKHLGLDMEKGEDTWRLRYEELENVPLSQWPEAAKTYSKLDSEATLKLYQHQKKRSIFMNYPLPTEYEDTRAAFALKLMSTYGITTDRPRVENLWNVTASRMHELGDVLQKEGLATVKKKSGALFEGGEETEIPDIKRSVIEIRKRVEKHHPDPPKTPKGAIKTDSDTLSECNYEPFDALMEFVGLQKSASSFVGKLFESPIHASFWPIGARSGRTSCSNPNLQNQPRLPGVRECFVAREGSDFLFCDFATQEMRTLAQAQLDLFGRSRLATYFQKDADFDPHMEFAKLLAKNNPNVSIGDLRQRAKTCNFGYPGGMAPPTFVQYAKGYGLNISLQESTDLKRIWMEQWPEMKSYFDFVSNLVGYEGATVTLERSGFRRHMCKYTQACNLFFQTLAGHASKRALWKVTKKCYHDIRSYLYGSRPVLYIHDEIGLEVPEGVGHWAAQEIEKVMEEAMEEYTPDIPSRAEAVLSKCWSKKAKKTVDSKGYLVPWEEGNND